MFELFSLLLETILIAIIIFIITVNLQKSPMESIWGDVLGSPGSEAASGDHEDLIKERDETHNQENTSHADVSLTNGSLKNTAVHEDNVSTDEIYVKSADKDLIGNENCTNTSLDRVENSENQNKQNTDDELGSNEVNPNCDGYSDRNQDSRGNVNTVDKVLISDNVCTKRTEIIHVDSIDTVNTERTYFSNNPAYSTDKVINEPENDTSSKDLHEETQLRVVTNVEKADSSAETNYDNSKTNKYIITVPKCTLRSEIETESYIKIVDLSNKMSKVYGMNGASYVDAEIPSRHDNDDLEEYEVYQMDRMASDDDEDLVTPLELHIQKLPQGVIVNSNVFLWDSQWHTMAVLDAQLFRCAVCQVYCDRLTCEDHVETLNHRRNLDKYRPLKRFDLSIVRKINTNLHCGVCNDIFDVIDYKIHENGKKHEENLLTAINKVSDLMYDSNIHVSYGERTFHSGFRNITNSDGFTNSDRRTSSSDRRTLSSDRRTLSSDRRTSSSDRRTSSSDRNVARNPGEFYFDANAINNNNINVYEEEGSESEGEESGEEEEEFEEACEELYEEEEFEEYNTPCQGVSYASMASKPTIELPKFLKIDLGTKEVRVKFESWHMITKIESNKFYCMVCSKKEHIRFKSRHCIGCEHVERLAKCTVVRAFEDYLIRKVDEKLYHCGHCNNLQYKNQMEDHIESAHPKKNRNFVETNNANKNTKSTTKTVIEHKKTESDKRSIMNKNIDYKNSVFVHPENEKNELKTDPNFDVFGDIPLSPFGCGLRILALNFNFIMKVEGEYRCAICDKVCADVKVHVEELEHVELMTMTPFIKPFQNHLTRAVRGMLHCSLCNELFPVAKVYDHNIDQPHTTALATAMGMKKAQKPKNTKRVTVLNLEDKNANILPFNIPATIQIQNLQIQKENVEPPSNQIDARNNLKMEQAPPQNGGPQNGGPQNGGPQNVNSYKGNQKVRQNQPDNGHNLLKVGQNYTTPELILNPGQILSQTGQNASKLGQNSSNSAQNVPKAANLGQTLPKPGQIFPFPQNVNPQTIKSIPPILNSMFPLLPPVNNQNLKTQFQGAPLMYNLPQRSITPFPNLTPNTSPNLLSPNIPPNQDIERKTLIITDRNVSGNNNSKTGIVKSRRDSDNSRTGSDNFRPGSNNSRAGSDNFRLGSDNSKNTRSDSDHSRAGSDNFRPGSDNSKNTRLDSDNSRPDSDNSKSVSDNVEIDSQSDDDELKIFDEEELVFVKFKTTYFKITNMSYNTLVFLDNGIRYCFACSSFVLTSQQQKHVESRKHAGCLRDNKFLDKYGMQLFRQMYLMYHCAICNELMTRKEIKLHLDWAGHVENYNSAHLILNKKNRKELKSGLKEYVVETQKEAIFHNVNEPNYHVRSAYQIVPNLDVKKDVVQNRPAKGSKSTALKKNKMVIQNNVVMKISFEHWHGITRAKNVTKCIICQQEITDDAVLDHVETDYHAVGLGKTFEKTYYPALIRKINENTVNCMTCNLELPNHEYMVHEHVSGRKHVKNRENIVNESSNSDSYADCYEDFLNV